MASPRHSADNPTGGPGDAPALPPGDYGPGFNAWGQPSSHGRLGPRYASHSYRGPVYELPTRLDVPPLDDSRRRNRISYDQAPPMGAPVGEGGRREEQRLRENVRRSRDTSSSHMEDELRRLRSQVREQHELIFSLKQGIERAELDRNHALARVAFMERSQDPPRFSGSSRDDRSYRPYPRPTPTSSSRDTSGGPDRTTKRLSLPQKRREIQGRVEAPAQTLRESPAAVPEPTVVPQSNPVVPQSDLVASGSNPDPNSLAAAYEQEMQYDDDEYNYSSDESTRAAKAKKEKDRQYTAMLRAQRKEAAKEKEGKKVPPPPRASESTAELHGSWANVPIISIEDWARLRTAATTARDDFALRYIAYLNTRHQQNAQEHRSAGVASLLREWGGLIKLDTGDTRARYASMRAPKARKSAAKPQGAQAPAPHVDTPRVNLPRTDAPRGASPGSNRPGPQATPQELLNYWSQVPMGDWPRGMRNHMGQLPDPSKPGELGSPDTDDMMAQRVLSDTMPPRRHRDTSTKIARLRYSNMFINLFSIQGLYRAIISRIGAPLGHRPRDGFLFDTRNMDLSHVALWLHDHGLSPASLEVRQLETWASRVRAISDHRAEDGNWSSFPCSLENVETDMFEVLNSLALSFSYPPRVPSAASRSWQTAAELFVVNARRRDGLEPIFTGISENDEATDDEMQPAGPLPPDPPL
jgi:hypothetical protein